MGDLGRQDWSQSGSLQITMNGQQSDRGNRLKDTWHTAPGVQYHPDEQRRINAGTAYDSLPYKSQSDVTLSMPTGDEWRFATGVRYRITPANNIGVAVEYSHMQSSNVKSDIFTGQCKNLWLWFVSVNYSYQFQRRYSQLNISRITNSYHSGLSIRRRLVTICWRSYHLRLFR